MGGVGVIARNAQAKLELRYGTGHKQGDVPYRRCVYAIVKGTPEERRFFR